MLLSASDQDASESEVTDDEVVAAAEALGEELAAAKKSSSEFAFPTMVMQCNEAIGDETGIDYGSVCGGDDDGCC
ncbi:halo-CC-star protein HcsS [Halorubrum laminariae]|uniref:Halo-CC-star protein HcsS n=1 Tax=Halorubrum laminariae TaxID=1433523 RepID=A0ABD6C330_9EURY|nr:halo-CC-star protein HcsS [Halorubrum laminariae]